MTRKQFQTYLDYLEQCGHFNRRAFEIPPTYSNGELDVFLFGQGRLTLTWLDGKPAFILKPALEEAPTHFEEGIQAIRAFEHAVGGRFLEELGLQILL